jgi:hypothetical protein
VLDQADDLPFGEGLTGRLQRCEASEPRAPAILHQNSDEVVVIAGAGVYAGAGKELEREVEAQRQGKCATEAPVALQVLVAIAVDGRGTTSEILPVECAPDAGAEIVDGVGLDGADRGLRAGVAIEEVGVVSEEARAGGEFDGERAEGLGGAEGRMDQRLVPMFTRREESYCPVGAVTMRLAPRMKSCW